MKQYPKPLAKLIGELSKLPGIGYKSAQRLAFHILDYDERQAQALADAIICAKREMTHCSICGNLTDRDPCRRQPPAGRHLRGRKPARCGSHGENPRV